MELEHAFGMLLWNSTFGNGLLVRDSSLCMNGCCRSPIWVRTAAMELHYGHRLPIWSSRMGLDCYSGTVTGLYCYKETPAVSCTAMGLQNGHLLLLLNSRMDIYNATVELLLLWNSGMDIHCYYRTSEWACLLCVHVLLPTLTHLKMSV